MKELSSHIKEEVKMQVECQQEKQKVLVDRFRKHPGQFVWEMNLRTQEIKLAEYSQEYADVNGGITREIIRKENHWYEPATNKKTAFKKFNNRAKQIITGKK